MKLAIVALAVLVACKKDGGTPQQGDVTQTPPPPQPQTSAVTLDGKPYVVAKALAAAQPDGTIVVYLTNKAATCDELLGKMFDKDEGEVHLLATLAPRLSPEGEETWTVAKASIEPASEQQPEQPVTVAGTADQGAKLDVTTELTVEGAPGTIAVKGTITAAGCGAPDTSKGPGVPKAKQASTATVTIGKKQLPLVGAIRKGDDVVLSDFPKDCSPATWYMGARLRRERGTWYLGGARFAKEQRATQPIELGVKPGATGKTEDGPTVELALSGSGQIGDYPIALAGTVQALDCPK